MSRVFRTLTFTRWMKKVNLTDAALCDAVAEMSQGLIDANLGGDIVKKRVALPGRGKRGGARTIIATKMTDRWFFIFGFSKNERDTINKDEMAALQEVAQELLNLNPQQLLAAQAAGEIVEICNDKT